VWLNAEVNGIWLTIWKDGIYTSSRYYQQSFKDVVISKIYLAFGLAKWYSELCFLLGCWSVIDWTQEICSREGIGM
jgi:hypothetical protein